MCLADIDVKSDDESSFWAYKCNDEMQCERELVNPPLADGYMGLTECKLTCGQCSRLWPKPNEGCVLLFYRLFIVN